MGLMDKGRARLQKSDRDRILRMVKQIRVQGQCLDVRDSRDYIWGYLDHNPLIGFKWVPKQGWRGFLTCMVNTHDDLDTVLAEAQEMQAVSVEMATAWENYKKSRSEKNWMIYQGIVAAMFMGGLGGER